MAFLVHADGTQAVVLSDANPINLDGAEEPGCSVVLSTYSAGDAVIVPAGPHTITAYIESSAANLSSGQVEWLYLDESDAGVINQTDTSGGGVASLSLSGTINYPEPRYVLLVANARSSPAGSFTVNTYLRVGCEGGWGLGKVRMGGGPWS